jgi:hypothetical protein
MGLGLLGLVVRADGQSKDRPAARQQAPSRGATHASRDNVARQNRPAAGGGYHPQNAPRGDRNAQRQPSYDNRASRDGRPQNQVRQAPQQPDPQQRLRSMSPQDRQRLSQREQQFKSLPPQKQQEMRQAVNNWNRMTPQQRDHIQNDILPKWKQMTPERQKAVSSRLQVLQNMPESARNRHLADPNFTRGMSEEDKQLLHDLSHEHVGAPDQHPEQ